MKNILTVLTCFTITFVRGWSTLDRTDKTYVIDFYKTAHKPLKECKDDIGEKLCNSFKSYCHRYQKLTDKCRKTCNDCVAVSPLSCHLSKHGCCWDGVTKSGVNGEGCPKCGDRYKSCRKLIEQCHLPKVRKDCPLSCQLKGCVDPNCKDDESQAPYCEEFKASGFCEQSEDLMKKYCKRTCNLCEKKETNRKSRRDEINDLEEIIETLKTDKYSSIKKDESNSRSTNKNTVTELQADTSKNSPKEFTRELISKNIKKLSDNALLSLIVSELKKRESNIIDKLNAGKSKNVLKADTYTNEAKVVKAIEKTVKDIREGMEKERKNNSKKDSNTEKKEKELLDLILNNAEILKSKD